jgi:hypothetical protein
MNLTVLSFDCTYKYLKKNWSNLCSLAFKKYMPYSLKLRYYIFQDGENIASWPFLLFTK